MRPRCQHCLKALSQCYCDHITPLHNQINIIIWQHPKERLHALNTARIAALSLSHCDIYNGNSIESCPELLERIERDKPSLLFPCSNATTITAEQSAQKNKPPQSILLLDATWRKAKRAYLESPTLQSLPTLSYTPEQANRYRLRKSPNAESQSTLEAIYFCLTALEQQAEAYYEPLLNTMDYVITQQAKHINPKTLATHFGPAIVQMGDCD